MAEKKGWFWWAGLDGEVENEGLYRFGEFATRDEAVAAGSDAIPDIDGNGFFHVIEAQFGEQAEEGDDFQPFGATRNHGLAGNLGSVEAV